MNEIQTRFENLARYVSSANATDRDRRAWASALDNATASEREGLARYSDEWAAVVVSSYGCALDAEEPTGVAWVLVSRPTRGRYFRPVGNVPGGLSWDAARELGDTLAAEGADVWLVPSRGAQAVGVVEDRDNVLLSDGRRVPIRWDADPVHSLPRTETFTDAAGRPAVRYLDDDEALGIAAGSELLAAPANPCCGCCVAAAERGELDHVPGPACPVGTGPCSCGFPVDWSHVTEDTEPRCPATFGSTGEEDDDRCVLAENHEPPRHETATRRRVGAAGEALPDW